MKRFSILALTGFFCLMMGHVSGQDFFSTNGSMCKILGDTSYATVAEVTFQPGQKTTVHTHAAQFVYALTDGTLTIHYSDGKTEEFALKQGDSFLTPPDRPHWTENKGMKPIKFLLVEFDEHPYSSKKKK